MHRNNFDFLRLAFALFVIVTHSITLSGSLLLDPLQFVSSRQITLSDLGLAGFFTISGFLVFESLKRSNSILDYYKKRFYRIYPGLTVALIITIIAAGIVSKIPLKDFFGNVAPYKYFVLKLSMFLRPNILYGAFENNPFPTEVNGSLWTIPYEFLFYVLLSFFFFIINKKKFFLIVIAIIYTLAIVIYYGREIFFPGYLYYYIKLPFRFFQYDFFFSFGFYFCAGVILANFRRVLYKYKNHIALLALILCAVFIRMNIFIVASHFVLPFLIISVGLMQTKPIDDLTSKIGDFSYGVYIYGFLIQQIIMNYFPLNYLQLLSVTIPIAILCGYISWNCVEKPFLKFKLKPTLSPNISLQQAT